MNRRQYGPTDFGLGYSRDLALQSILDRHPRKIRQGPARGIIEEYQGRKPALIVKVTGSNLTQERIGDAARSYASLSVLVPTVVVAGTGKPLSDRLGNTIKYRGIRRTTPKELEVVRDVAYEVTEALVDRINRRGGDAYPFISDSPDDPYFVFHKLNTVRDEEGEHDIGEVVIAPPGKEAGCMTSKGLERLMSLLADGHTPVVGPLAHYETGNGYALGNPDADDITCVTARLTIPEWLIFVTERAEDLSIDLAKARNQARNTTNEWLRNFAPEDHYRNEDWKIRVALEMAGNGIKTATTIQDDLLPFVFNRYPRYSRKYAQAVLTPKDVGINWNPG